MRLHNIESPSLIEQADRRPPLAKIARSWRKSRATWPDAAVGPGLRAPRGGRFARGKTAATISLVYGSDRSVAVPGDTVIFTAWITNDSRSHLRNIRLIPRSFTNEAMEPLAYSSAPAREDLAIPSLAPGEAVMRSFSYQVTATDHIHGGSLVSAMQVKALCLGRHVSDEHDAIVSLTGARMSWPFRSAKPGLGYWNITRIASVSPRRRPRTLVSAAN